MLNVIQNIKNLIFRPSLSREAALAYYNRLPDRIRVEWFRDGKFIIGRIKIENEEGFMTQAISAQEFVDMVNDGLFAYYDIPNEYLGVLKKCKQFVPPANEFAKLNDAAIEKSEIGFQKERCLA